MKTTLGFTCLCLYLAILLGVRPSHAASYQVLHSFSGLDGTNPQGNLTAAPDGMALYGVTAYGGTYGSGTIYSFGPGGAGFQSIHSFHEFEGPGTEGYDPQGGLLLVDSTLYGAVRNGTRQESGGHFSVTTNGSNFHNIPLDRWNEPTPFWGYLPVGDFLDGNFMTYSVMSYGGANQNGVIAGMYPPFALPGGVGAASHPEAGVVAIGNQLFGTTSAGGAFDQGTIFTLNNDGTGFHILHSFDGTDGIAPTTKLTVVQFSPSDSLLFGTANNTLFYMKPDGSDFNVYDTGAFTSSLTLDGMILYGAQADRIFALDLDSGEITTLHTFGTPSEGLSPQGGLTVVGPWLYGTTSAGGDHGQGTLFRIQVGVVPEPASVTLAIAALCSLAVVWHRSRRSIAGR